MMEIEQDHHRDGEQLREFVAIDQLREAIPWIEMVLILESNLSIDRSFYKPAITETMLRAYMLQKHLNLTDFAFFSALFVKPQFRQFCGINGIDSIPNCATILRFRLLFSEAAISDQRLQCVESMVRLPNISQSNQRKRKEQSLMSRLFWNSVKKVQKASTSMS